MWWRGGMGCAASSPAVVVSEPSTRPAPQKAPAEASPAAAPAAAPAADVPAGERVVDYFADDFKLERKSSIKDVVKDKPTRWARLRKEFLTASRNPLKQDRVFDVVKALREQQSQEEAKSRLSRTLESIAAGGQTPEDCVPPRPPEPPPDENPFQKMVSTARKSVVSLLSAVVGSETGRGAGASTGGEAAAAKPGHQSYFEEDFCNDRASDTAAGEWREKPPSAQQVHLQELSKHAAAPQEDTANKLSETLAGFATSARKSVTSLFQTTVGGQPSPRSGAKDVVKV